MIHEPREFDRREVTTAFNVLHPDRRVVDERYDLSDDARRRRVREGMTLDDYVRELGLPSGGAVRASLGLVSNFADVHRFATFSGEFVDLVKVQAIARICRDFHSYTREDANLRPAVWLKPT